MLASILINNYNYAAYLTQCIESLLQQSYQNIEIIVYDDGSTDHSLEVLSRYPQIKVISNDNYGKNHNFNQMNAVYQAFKESQGEYIFLLDSDDWFREDKVARIIAVFMQHEEVQAIQHTLEEVDAYGNSLGMVVPVIKAVTNYKEEIYNTENLFHLFSTTSALSFRRGFLNRVLPLKEDDYSNLAVDTRLMLHAAISSSVHTIYEPFSYYRKHGANDSYRLGDPDAHKRYSASLYSYFNEIAHSYNLPTIHYSENRMLEHTFFYSQININKCTAFLGEEQYWIWGAGEAGCSIMHALKNINANIAGFIDVDVRKQKQQIMGVMVYPPEHVMSSNHIKILISPYHAIEPIKRQLVSNNWVENKQFIDPYVREQW